MTRRVVITGLGMVAPTGNCVPDAWAAALDCRSGVEKIRSFDASQLPVQFAAEVKGFDATEMLGPKVTRQSSKFVQFTATAVREAVQDSGLEPTDKPHRRGCIIGVGLGAFRRIEEESIVFRDKGPRRVSPCLLPYAIPNMAGGFASILEGFQGPSFSTASACASGTHAIGEAFLHLSFGTADVMIAGGAEAAISPLSVSSFAKMRALSSRNDTPETASRPFDLDRDGFVMGEGAGIVVLEELEHAGRRGARIYAELAGYGASCDAHHITMPAPEGQGIARSMVEALKSGEISVDQVDYINAHGTSTQANDATESAGIEMVFGEHSQGLSISSTKGVTGHCLGAAGAIEAVYTILAMRDSVVPPTANYTTSDPACPLNYTPNTPREHPVQIALSNSCGFGGQNACLAFKQFA